MGQRQQELHDTLEDSAGERARTLDARLRDLQPELAAMQSGADPKANDAADAGARSSAVAVQ